MSTVDIHEPIFELCRRLGYDPNDVAEIQFTPTETIVVAFTRDKDGRIVVKNGEPVMVTDQIEVRT